MEKKKEKTLGIIHMDEREDSQINHLDQIFNNTIEGNIPKLWKDIYIKYIYIKA